MVNRLMTSLFKLYICCRNWARARRLPLLSSGGSRISGKGVHTPRTRFCVIYRSPLGCYEKLIRSDLFIYSSRRSVHIYIKVWGVGVRFAAFISIIWSH